MKVSVLALVLLLATGVVMGQGPPDRPPGPPNPEHQLERLATLLDLTDSQKAQVKTILDAEHAKMKAQFEAARASGTKPSFDAMHALHEQLQAETVQQLTPVLSASQLKKFEVLREEQHGPHGAGPHGPPSGAAPPVSSN
jgi:Spy/CpxP family protein refolding chaperone